MRRNRKVATRDPRALVTLFARAPFLPPSTPSNAFPSPPLQPPEQGTNPKEDAAQTLSNLSQASFPPPPPPAVPGTHPQMHHYLQAAAAAAGVTDPGPSSH